jgi:hypothetical protein
MGLGWHATDRPCPPFHQSDNHGIGRAGEPLAVGPARALPDAGEIPASALGGGRSAGHRREHDFGRGQLPGSRFIRRQQRPCPTCPTSLVRNNSAYQLFRKASCANLAREGRAGLCGPRGLAGWQKTTTFRRCHGVREVIRRGWDPGRRLGRWCCPSPWCSRSLACWTPSGQRHHLTTALPGPSGQPRTTQIPLRGQHRCPGGCRARAPCGSRPRR